MNLFEQKMNLFEQKKLVFWFITLGLIGFCTYLLIIPIHRYGDDLAHVFISPSSKIFYYFLNANPRIDWYRPIEASFFAIVQTYFGLNTLPIHLTHISIHFLFSCFIFFVMVGMGFSKIQAALGFTFMAVSQTNVDPVLSPDTLSQVIGTLFGYISLWLLYTFSLRVRESKDNATGFINYKNYLLSILMFLLSLFSKESSVAFFIPLMAIILYKNWTNKRLTPSLIRRTIIDVSPYLAVTAFYLIIRFSVGIIMPPRLERYDFQAGVNIIENIGMLSFAALVPLSSVTTFITLMSGELVKFFVIIIITFALFAFVAYGLWLSDKRPIILSLTVLIFISFFPTVLLNQVSERYVYNSIPLVSILMGIGLGKQIELSKVSPARQIVITVLISLLFISHIAAIHSKGLLMKASGELAAKQLEQIELYVDKVPKGGELILLDPPSNQIEYSVYHTIGFEAFRGGTNIIHYTTNRYDFITRIVRSTEGLEPRPDCLILTTHDEAVQIYQNNDTICH